MPTPKTTSLAAILPTGDELYNALMSNIEPELTTDQLPYLDDKYKNETPEQAKARHERYERAYEKYDTQVNAFFEALTTATRSYQKVARQSVEQNQQVKDQQTLFGLEQAMGYA